MDKAIDLKELKPVDILGVKMGPDRVIHVWFNYPILNAEVDYQVASHLTNEQKRLEEIYGKATGMLIDITNYNRLDCVDFLGITIPSTKVRELTHKSLEKAIIKRIAFYKKDTSRMAEACVKLATASSKPEVRLFSNIEKAFKWLN